MVSDSLRRKALRTFVAYRFPFTGIITPGETARYIDTDTIDIEKVPLNGGFLVKNLVVSVEYYLMAMMREPDSGPLVSRSNYTCNIDKRKNDAFEHPSHSSPSETCRGHYHFTLWTMFADEAWQANQLWCWSSHPLRKLRGQGWRTRIRDAHTVIQLAKADGLKVIASAGSDEKVDFLKAIGVDIAFNYKSTSVDDVLAKEGPIDMNAEWVQVMDFFSEPLLQHFSDKTIDFVGYTGGFKPVTNLMNIITRSITIHGFIVTDLEPKYREDFYATIPAKLASGEFKYKEDVTEGLENVGEVILQMQMGTNKGKLVIKIADA
ncbi:hypothetical protein H0H87_006144 [Tephrocybe sp. NHM501043]|nr:hypothetical protein H0H87_006144 [Tephrocybe sp. NHM501043]